MKKSYKLILDDEILEEYNKVYFAKHPKAHKIPIERPIHPSLNVWMILHNQAMNVLKQKWKDFIVWWINKLGLQDEHLEQFTMEFIMYMPTKRRSDPDNMSPKFIMDGFTEAGFIVDDDGKHLKALTLITDYDKDHPRTEIKVKVCKEKKENE